MLETPAEFALNFWGLSISARGVVALVLAVPVSALLVAFAMRLVRR